MLKKGSKPQVFFIKQMEANLFIYYSIVQPCRLSPRVAKGRLFVFRSRKILQFLLHISLNCSGSKDSFATNVATGTFWLDTPVQKKQRKNIFSYFGICPIFGGRLRTEDVFSAPEIEPETK
jgi:hypothetical protein